MGKFVVIDTETNRADQVISIGTIIADEDINAIIHKFLSYYSYTCI